MPWINCALTLALVVFVGIICRAMLSEQCSNNGRLRGPVPSLVAVFPLDFEKKRLNGVWFKSHFSYFCRGLFPSVITWVIAGV